MSKSSPGGSNRLTSISVESLRQSADSTRSPQDTRKDKECAEANKLGKIPQIHVAVAIDSSGGSFQ